MKVNAVSKQPKLLASKQFSVFNKTLSFWIKIKNRRESRCLKTQTKRFNPFQISV